MEKIDYSPDVTEDCLCHHGILGMHWGIRRFQNKDGSYTSAGIKRYNLSDEYKKNLSKERQISENDKDTVYKSGTKAYRVQSKSYDNERKGHSYISMDEMDHMKYISMAGEEAGLGSDNSALYCSGNIYGKSITLKITNDLIVPSYNQQIDSFINTVANQGLKEVAEAASSEWSGYSAKNFVNDFTNMKRTECIDRAYHEFSKTLMSNENMRNTFFEDLKSKGYNAVVDEWDANQSNSQGGYAKTSLVVFERTDNLKSESERDITQRMKDEAYLKTINT